MPINANDICARFSQVPWHDSKIIDLHLARSTDKLEYDLRLDLNLITPGTKDRSEINHHSAVFVGCRLIKADLDLLGVLICNGAIASGVCYADPTELEERNRFTAQQFGFPQDHNPVEKCLGFLLEMINPGGEIIVFAQDFQLHKTLPDS